eukprot:TRINITY_DN846_c2_g1_i1.p1 TRINITY_DN846_c2_g1~~TRINITY_DN846_c2_g1_i1.p1  ORF type:complete len:101 (-),score=9.49 TRINITY_DN846_c2_g1_i1:7-309(-)
MVLFTGVGTCRQGSRSIVTHRPAIGQAVLAKTVLPQTAEAAGKRTTHVIGYVKVRAIRLPTLHVLRHGSESSSSSSSSSCSSSVVVVVVVVVILTLPCLL